jgi:AraC-like DNA-binding protein
MAGVRHKSSRLTFTRKDGLLPGVIMLGRYQHVASDTGLSPHRHHGALEICFLERGLQTYRVQGRLYRMRGNDQFFTLPDEIHDTADLPEERGILYWLILNISRPGPFLGLAHADASRLKLELLHMPRRHFRAHRDCAGVLGELIDLTAAAKPHYQPYRQLRLQALLLQYLTLTIAASREGLPGTASPLMGRVLAYIAAHLSEPVQVGRLAQVARLSESRLKSRFKREVGVPPAEYWLRQKIEKAAVLLKSKSVTFVAHELGFSSSQYFAMVFKRYTMQNPSSCRSSGNPI